MTEGTISIECHWCGGKGRRRYKRRRPKKYGPCDQCEGMGIRYLKAGNVTITFDVTEVNTKSLKNLFYGS